MKTYCLVLSLLLAGCTSFLGPAGLAVDAITGGVGIFQRYEDRQAQRDQTAAIREQTAEVIKLREAIEQRWPVMSR